MLFLLLTYRKVKSDSMWKVLIADDEPKIRRGLRNSLEWSELDMEVVGEAEDGEVALKMVKNLKPDILLVDINMPFLDGLQLIEQINKVHPGCITIVITGYDEFTYAQKAVKLKVFDFLLKPVMKEQLHSVIIRAREELIASQLKDKYINWANQQLKNKLPFLKESFLNDWVNNHLTEFEIVEQLDFLEMKFSSDSAMLVIKLVERFNKGELLKERDRHLILFSIQNIIDELMQDWEPKVVFMDNKDNMVVITSIKNVSQWVDLGEKVEAAIEKNLKQMIVFSQEKIEGSIYNTPLIYEKLLGEINSKGSHTPIVTLAKKYIDTNYYKDTLSLQDVSLEMQVSPTYLSRLLKQELGISFIDYLTQVRVKKAIQLMNDPSLKIYEVAERVGYNTQHYFSTAFKKVLQVSPIEYRKGGMK